MVHDTFRSKLICRWLIARRHLCTSDPSSWPLSDNAWFPATLPLLILMHEYDRNENQRYIVNFLKWFTVNTLKIIFLIQKYYTYVPIPKNTSNNSVNEISLEYYFIRSFQHVNVLSYIKTTKAFRICVYKEYQF